MSEVELLRAAANYGMAMSDDPRTRVGSVIDLRPCAADEGGLVFGANQIPEGVLYSDARVSQEHKSRYVEHAERDAIFNAARLGRSTRGRTMYAPWFACCCCARAIIIADIREVVGLMSLHSMTPARWSADIAAAHQMLGEAGVAMRWITAELGTTILFDGKEIEV
jgi:dCMP deaminase